LPNFILIGLAFYTIIFGLFFGFVGWIDCIVPPLFIFFLFWIIDHFKIGFVGGGDIKYLMIASIYLGILLLPYFILICGALSTVTLLFLQNKKLQHIPMIPSLTLSVGITELLTYFLPL
jgi:Flp pilus assembly protein protease CpaA